MIRLAAVLILVFVALAMFAPKTSAIGGPAPTLNTNSVNCYRNIIDAGDLYCLIRYELPTFTTGTPPPGSPEAWCAELIDQDGCITDPVEPTNETSVIQDAAFVTLYQNCGVDCTTGTLEHQGRIPRINHALGGAYLSAGHAVTWDDPTVNGCVESSSTLYTVQSQSCFAVVWHTAATDLESQRTVLGTALVGDLRSIESARGLQIGSLVTGSNLVSIAGRELAKEALSVMDQIVPERFQAASAAAIVTGYATPTGDTALQTDLDTTASGTDLVAAFADLGNTLAGLSGGAMATIMFLAVALIAFWWLHKRTDEYVIPSFGFVTVAMIGVFVRGPSVSVVAVAAVALSLVGAMFMLRKVPTG